MCVKVANRRYCGACNAEYDGQFHELTISVPNSAILKRSTFAAPIGKNNRINNFCCIVRQAQMAR